MCTTNSVNDRQIEQILKGFLEGLHSLSSVQKMLSSYVTINFDLAPARREIPENTLDDEAIRITVNGEHVRQMLQRYVSGKISELELSNWAALVLMLPVFVPSGETEDERWESGNGPEWNIIQKLVTPDLFDGLDLEIAHHYLDLLG
jgi:hypothetical protein